MLILSSNTPSFELSCPEAKHFMMLLSTSFYAVWSTLRPLSLRPEVPKTAFALINTSKYMTTSFILRTAKRPPKFPSVGQFSLTLKILGYLATPILQEPHIHLTRIFKHPASKFLNFFHSPVFLSMNRLTWVFLRWSLYLAPVGLDLTTAMHSPNP